jgi:hypothetical protein
VLAIDPRASLGIPALFVELGMPDILTHEVVIIVVDDRKFVLGEGNQPRAVITLNRVRLAGLRGATSTTTWDNAPRSAFVQVGIERASGKFEFA